MGVMRLRREVALVNMTSSALRAMQHHGYGPRRALQFGAELVPLGRDGRELDVNAVQARGVVINAIVLRYAPLLCRLRPLSQLGIPECELFRLAGHLGQFVSGGVVVAACRLEQLHDACNPIPARPEGIGEGLAWVGGGHLLSSLGSDVQNSSLSNSRFAIAFRSAYT